MSARPMSVCFFIQSHRDPEQVYRLVRTLRGGSDDATIVVQHNSRACALDWAPLASLSGVRQFFARRPQIRSNFSCQIEPYLDVVEWLDRDGLEYDWLVNLTAQDYPVKPVAELEVFLEAAPADGYLRFWDVLSPQSPWSRRRARARYWHRYWLLPEGSERPLRALRFLTTFLPIHFYLACGPWVGARRLRTPFTAGFRCYGGWAWFSLRREAARYLRESLAARPDIEAHYRRTMIPEESLVQTVLVNSGRFRLVDDDLRYIDYSRAERGSPRALTTADLPMLASGPWYLARKFDLGVDRGVLDRIDQELLAAPGAVSAATGGRRGESA
jgi:core-2/I-Branching enzyme